MKLPPELEYTPTERAAFAEWYAAMLMRTEREKQAKRRADKVTAGKIAKRWKKRKA